MFNKLRKQAKKTEKDLEKAHKERVERCIPVARECLSVLLGRISSLPMGDEVDESKEYHDIALEFLTIFLRNNIHWSDREFILQLAMQPFEFPKNIALRSISQSWDRALTGKFGKKIYELRISDVDNALKKANEVDPEIDDVV